MPSYPPPSENPRCTCWPNMLAAMFCPNGHMTECHAPMDCEEAECGHYLFEHGHLDPESLELKPAEPEEPEAA